MSGMNSLFHVASFVDAIFTRKDDLDCHKFRRWNLDETVSIRHILRAWTLSNVCGNGGGTVRVHGSRRERARCRERCPRSRVGTRSNFEAIFETVWV